MLTVKTFLVTPQVCGIYGIDKKNNFGSTTLIRKGKYLRVITPKPAFFANIFNKVFFTGDKTNKNS